MIIKRALAFLSLVCLMISAFSAFAQVPWSKADSCESNNSTMICPSRSVWSKFGTVSLVMSDDAKTSQAKWQLQTTKDGDIRLLIDVEGEGQKQKGAILLIAGNAMLTNGLTLKEGSEIDSLDAPTLMVQLATGLLQYAFPEGPKAIPKEISIDRTENTKAIWLGTPSTNAGPIPLPWQVKGNIGRAGKKVVFDLKFIRNPKESRERSMNITGSWEAAPSSLVLDDKMSLKEWKYYKLGVYETKMRGGTMIDYSARPQATNYESLGDLRKALAAEKQK